MDQEMWILEQIKQDNGAPPEIFFMWISFNTFFSQ
jgi:hypothetical protein